MEKWQKFNNVLWDGKDEYITLEDDFKIKSKKRYKSFMLTFWTTVLYDGEEHTYNIFTNQLLKNNEDYEKMLESFRKDKKNEKI